jgi:sulfur carrier protein
LCSMILSSRQLHRSVLSVSCRRGRPNDVGVLEKPMTQRVIRINGESEPLAAATLAALLEEKAVDTSQRGIAVAVNGAVVPRAAWPSTQLRAGDSIEIVRARQGG